MAFIFAWLQVRDGREVAVFTKSPSKRACGVDSAFRCCKIRNLNNYPFCSYSAERVIFMRKFFPKLNVKGICVLGLLTSITIVLAVFGTFRIGNAIKIPVKFVSVFIGAILYGPVWGGIVAATGDLFNCLLAPSGVFMPQITAIEFLNGFIFGIFFYSQRFSGRTFIIRTFLCTLILFGVDMILSSLALVMVGIFPSFGVAFSIRLWAGIIKGVLHCGFIFISKSYVEKLRRLIK